MSFRELDNRTLKMSSVALLTNWSFCRGLGSMDAANDPWLDPNKDGWMMPPNK